MSGVEPDADGSYAGAATALRAYARLLDADPALEQWPQCLPLLRQRLGAAAPLDALAARLSALAPGAARRQALADWHMAHGDAACTELALRALLHRDGDSPETLSNLAHALSQQRQYAEAVTLLRRALASRPGLAAAWANLAVALQALGDTAGAAEAQQRLQRLAPDAPSSLVARGLEAYRHGHLGEAMACHRRAVLQAPQLPEAWINLAIALNDSGDAAAAGTALEQALSLAPGDSRAASNRLMCAQYDDSLGAQALRALTNRVAQAWPVAAPADERPSNPGAPLRVAYLGGDFRQHPVGWLLLPVLKSHDRRGVECHLLDTQSGRDPADPVAQALRGACHAWHDVSSLTDEALAEHVQRLGIDVLVDLAGHTDHGRPGVLARRPAPRQLAWLGWPASTGHGLVDALLLGGAMWTEAAAASCTEPVLRLPRFHMAYEPPDYAPAPAPEPPVALGRPLTFGCFNNTAKLNDAVLACWAKVLAAVPHSRLLLKWRSLADPWMRTQLQARMRAQGLDPDRVECRAASAHADMLAEYADVDIALDPFPFSGGLSSFEALWMGVPVVTLPWLRPASRQTLAMLEVLGLENLAAPDVAGYVRVATELAADLPRLRALRQTLRERCRDSALSDGESLARALEAVYRQPLPRDAAGPGRNEWSQEVA